MQGARIGFDVWVDLIFVAVRFWILDLCIFICILCSGLVVSFLFLFLGVHLAISHLLMIVTEGYLGGIVVPAHRASVCRNST